MHITEQPRENAASTHKSISYIWIVYAVLSFLFFRHQQIFHSLAGCDDIGYLDMMKVYAAHGIVKTNLSDVRLYGYPFFLAGLYQASQILNIHINLAIFFTQFALYCLASLWLARTVTKYVSTTAGCVIALGMALNIFLAPYFSLALTDSLSLTIQITIIAAIATLYFGKDGRLRDIWLSGLIGFMTGFAIMVRPANILFPAVAVMGVVVCLIRTENGKTSRALKLGIFGTLGFVLAVFPQIASNVAFYNKWTFMPVIHLGSIQIDAGQAYLKYASHMVSNDPKAWNGMPYLNPWYSGDGHRSLLWYFRHPGAGVKTVTFHIFGALDFDALFPYIYNTRPWYRPLLFIACQTVNFWAVIGAFQCTRNAIKGPDPALRATAWSATAVLATFIITWLAVYAVSAVENRFALPMTAILIPLAVWAIWRRVQKRKIEATSIAIFLVYLAVAAWASVFLSTLRTNV